jgi:signal transduction histidine kinase
VIVWANDQFYEITGHSNDHYELSFVDVVDPADQATSANLWPVLVTERKSVSSPFRLKRRWRPPASPGATTPEEEPRWIHATAFPVVENGEVKSVAASVIDITQYKWAETIQHSMANKANEAKRLQENFIDIVSHEMRNPLSAITQLAEDVSKGLEELDGAGEARAREILESNVESAKTILLCAAHQKRIIDDVLTLSKLDSMMLSITPIVGKSSFSVYNGWHLAREHFTQSMHWSFQGISDIQIPSFLSKSTPFSFSTAEISSPLLLVLTSV